MEVSFVHGTLFKDDYLLKVFRVRKKTGSFFRGSFVTKIYLLKILHGGVPSTVVLSSRNFYRGSSNFSTQEPSRKFL